MHVFTLLGDPVRLRIVELLAKRELPVWKLVDAVGSEFHVGQPAVSHQLRILRDAEFVVVRVDGRIRHHRLSWNALDRVDAVVESLFTIWENRVGRPYAEFLPEPPPRLHREGRKGLRGRTQEQIEPRSEDDWWDFLRD